MKIDVTSFQPSDACVLLDQARGWVSRPYMRYAQFADLAAAPAVSLWAGDALLACCGITLYWPHVASLWSIVGEDARRHPIALYRATVSLLDGIVRARDLHRIEATIVRGFEPGRKWAELHGFSYESSKPLAGPNGETIDMYVKFPQKGRVNG